VSPSSSLFSSTHFAGAIGAASSRRHLRLGSRLSTVVRMLDLRHPGTIADIGHANGYLLAELDELGCTDLVGVDKNPDLANKVMYTARHKWKGQPQWLTGNGLSSFAPGQVRSPF
jgi:hypothetical protein